MRRLGPALRWLLAAAIVGYSGWQLADAWSSLEATPPSLRPGPTLASLATGGLALVTLAAVSACGARAAGLGSAGGRFWIGWLRVWFQAYFYRYVPGKVVLVLERVRLGERLGVPRAASVMLVVWESLLLVAGAGLVGGVGLLSLPTGGPVSGAAVVALAVGSLSASVLLGPLVGAVAARSAWVRERLPGVVLEVRPLAQLGLVLGNAAAWALLGGSFALCARAMTPGDLPPPAVLVTWFVASYVGGQVASVTPAGLGVREGLLVAGLAEVVPAPVALMWAVGHRVVLSAAELALVAAAALIRLPPSEPGQP